MVKEVGSTFSKVVYVYKEMAEKDGKKFVVRKDWVKKIYEVTENGNKCIQITLPTEEEIEQAKAMRKEKVDRINKKINDFFAKLEDNDDEEEKEEE